MSFLTHFRYALQQLPHAMFQSMNPPTPLHRWAFISCSLDQKMKSVDRANKDNNICVLNSLENKHVKTALEKSDDKNILEEFYLKEY